MIRKLLKIGLISLGSLVGVAILAVALLIFTSPGRNVTARIASDMLSGETFAIAIGDIGGSSLADLHFDQISIGDAQGPWLLIDDAVLDWSPWSLFAGRFQVSRLTAEKIVVLRTPVSAETEEPSTTTLPPIGIKLDELSIRRLDLEAPVLGAPAVLAVDGTLALVDPGDLLSGTLGIQRRDGAGGVLNAKFSYGPATQQLAVDAKFSEPQDGIVSTLMGVPGAPATAGEIVGTGSLNDWNATISLDAGAQRLVAGTVRIEGSDTGRRITAGLGGELAYLVPQRFQSLLEGESRLQAIVTWRPGGLIDVDRAELASRTTRMALTASGDLDLNITRARINAEIVSSEGGMVTIPLDHGKNFVFQDAKLTAELGAQEGPAPITANLVARGLATAEGQIGTLTAAFSGARADAALSSLWTSSRGHLRIQAANPKLADPKLQSVLGETVSLDARLGLNPDGLTISESSLSLGTGVLRYAGTLREGTAEGSASVAVQNLGAFAALTGMQLKGAATLSATGKVGLADQLFALSLDGTVKDLGMTGEGAARQVPGAIKLTGSVARQAGGDIAISGLKLQGEGLSAAVDGVVNDARADLNATAHIGNLSLFNPRLAGAADIVFTAKGTPENASFDARVTGNGLAVEGRPFENPVITFTGAGPIAAPQGKLTVAGRFQGRDLSGSTNLARASDGAIALDDLTLGFGAARAAGGIRIAADGTPDGSLSIDVDDLGAFQALAGMPLAGLFKGDLRFQPGNGDVVASLKGVGNGLRLDSLSVASIAIDARVDALMSAPVAQGTLRASGAKSGGMDFGVINVNARADGQATELDLTTSVAGADLAATARIAASSGNVAVGLQRLRLASRGEVATLASPVTVTMANGVLTIPPATFTSRGGRLAVRGTAGQTLDLRAELNNVPASLMAVVAPDLDPAGTISGTAAVSGPASTPNVSYRLDWRGAAVAATRAANLPPLSIVANGATQGNRVTLDGTVSGAADFSIRVTGSAPMGAGNLALDVKGALPGSLLNQMLASSSAAFTGTINVDLKVAGSPADPQITGTVITNGARFTAVSAGVTLEAIVLRARLNGKRVVIEQFNAKSPEGGTIQVSGDLSIDPATGMPANLRIRAESFRINDRRMAEGALGADLTLTGPMATRPVLGGRVNIDRLNITIPEKLPQSIARLNVKHVNAPAEIQAQVKARQAQESSAALPIVLDLRLDAGNQIFIRGRGLDVVLGGSIRVTGMADNPVAVGAFEIRRGNLAILGKRLTFSRGLLDFQGSFDPELDFAAQSSASGVTATVLVTGKASDPKFSFESTPALPQDEVLSRLIFDKPLDQLSPLQVGQLSLEVARLGGLGGSGPGLLDQLRTSLGVDVLEVTGEEDQRNAAVSAGKYVNDNVYVGVKQTTSGTSSAVVDLNVTKNIQLKGEVGSDGSSKLGVGVEWDY
ncbi:translocation and assembly module TamB [Rhodoligotrophos appendicifer]|uniref:translocation/assembly module TamB domain-containing protein n=1 Tax=Rhodoligotrophos appendicifer TaxID=987056 RepID=UPI001185FA2B|nr:translocation/assembly module TamB domain-containing protein [Rhodoligotrophos appendicifer]